MDEKKARRLERHIDDLNEEKKCILAERKEVAGKLQAVGMQLSILLIIIILPCTLSM